MTAVEYIKVKHETLKNNYLMPDGAYTEHCGFIALEISKLLIQENKRPRVILISGATIKNGILEHTLLSPKQFNGEVKWGAHQVCFCNGYVYDPILNKPIQGLNNYLIEVFGQRIKTTVAFGYKAIKEMIDAGII